MRNLQRDGHMQMDVAKGRAAYEPNCLSEDSPRECPVKGFTAHPREKSGAAVRLRAESFADRCSQAPLLRAAGIDTDDGDVGLVPLSRKNDVKPFVAAAKTPRIWKREPSVRMIP